MQGKVKTCFIYVRVSTKMQAEQGESIEAQQYELERYAKLNDMRVLKTMDIQARASRGVLTFRKCWKR